MKIRKIDHVGIIVNDLSAVKEFFLNFGLVILGQGVVEGEWAERIFGRQNIHDRVAMMEVVMLRAPNGGADIELVKFHTTAEESGRQNHLGNTPNSCHIAFAVEDIEALVTKLEKRGTGLIGEIQKYDNAYKLCYVRGPEGIILELAEKIE